MAFRFLSHEDMFKAGVANMDGCIEVMQEVFDLLGQGDYVMGGSTRNSHGLRVWFPLEPKFEGMPKGGPDQRFMSLSGYLGGRFNVCGNKWYGSNVHNPAKHGLPRSVLMMTLNDPETARPLAIMAGNTLSSVRTGAVVGLAARYLACEDSETLGVVAAGPINSICVKAILRTVPSIKKVVVFDIREEASRKLADAVKAGSDIEVSVVHDMASAVKGMDIVTSAVSGEGTPLIENAWLKEGSLLALPGRARVEDAYLLSSHIVPDCWEMQKTYNIEGHLMKPGERMIPHARLHEMVADGQIAEDTIRDLGQIVAGNAMVDRNSSKRKYFLSNGMILQDLAWGMCMFRRAEEMNLGQNIVMWEHPSA
ncbi:MAG: hypothetical protein A2289_02100 [Deltaproteobacteria bacterium RIFOXYA12_FULL_58_15]|nr:MAG: hypothetical protein A2289_02100 [Deltaproteobacteria bacterium RIFOXYA12_FULL_58_15]